MVNLRGVRNPFGVTPAAASTTAIVFGVAGLVGFAVLAAWSLFSRSRRGPAVERQQIKWLAYSGCLVALTLVPSTILSQSPGTAARIAEGALMVAVLTMPAAVAVAVLKYRLYEIDRIISRTLAYAVLTTLMAGGYAGLVLLATRVPGVTTPPAVATATLAAAALFNPLRHRVQRAVDRRFNRARYTPAKQSRRSLPGSRTPSTWTRSRPTWPTSCSKPWSPPTSQCGAGHASEPGLQVPLRRPDGGRSQPTALARGDQADIATGPPRVLPARAWLVCADDH